MRKSERGNHWVRPPEVPYDENFEHVRRHPHGTATTSDVPKIGAATAHPACERLLKRAFAPDELPSLIEAIFSNEDECSAIRSLLGNDAQTFIDVMDEVRSTPAHDRKSAN